MLTLEITAKTLSQHLRAASAICRKSSIPVLSHALLKCEGNHVSICTSDLDRWITSEIECSGRGAATINADDLESIVASLDAGSPVGLKANGSGVVEITQGRAHFRLPTLPPEDFPTPPDRKVMQTWILDAPVLASALKSLEPAIERGKRDYLKGVFFDLRRGRLVTTNGHILGYSTIEGLHTEDRDVPDFTMPVDAISVVLGLCKAGGEIAVSIHEGASSMQFLSGSTLFRTKLMDADWKFPDYDRVVPKVGQLKGAVKSADFLRAVSCASNVAQDHSSGVRIEAEFTETEIILSAHDREGRHATDVCGWEYETGNCFKAAFSAPYLQWAASTLNAKDLHFEIQGAEGALIMRRPEDVEREEIRLAMPMA